MTPGVASANARDNLPHLDGIGQPLPAHSFDPR